MKLKDLRAKARMGVFSSKKIRCQGCGNGVYVDGSVVGVGKCDKCPESNGWRRIYPHGACQITGCKAKVFYVREHDAGIGYCRMHAIRISSSMNGMIEVDK